MSVDEKEKRIIELNDERLVLIREMKVLDPEHTYECQKRILEIEEELRKIIYG